MRILHAALAAVDPRALVTQFLGTEAIPGYVRCFLLGLGKASERMAIGAAMSIPDFSEGIVVTKRRLEALDSRFRVMEGDHPIPGDRSIEAGTALLDFVRRLRTEDLLVCLISGGGSALATIPAPGVSLGELRQLTGTGLSSGATIQSINTRRRQLDMLKGGGLAAATPARVLGLILSDVIGDQPELVASGPTVPLNAPVWRDAAQPGERGLDVSRRAAASALARHGHDQNGAGTRVTNFVIGDVALAARAARDAAQLEGFNTELVAVDVVGEARSVGQRLGRRLADESRSRERPFCLIAAGETTVSLSSAPGRGGRNQELALSAVEPLAGAEGCLLVTLATDGEDGTTDAGGAAVDSTTAQRAASRGMYVLDFLERNNSYEFFCSLGDALKPGYTGTNVNDLTLMFAF